MIEYAFLLLSAAVSIFMVVYLVRYVVPLIIIGCVKLIKGK